MKRDDVGVPRVGFFGSLRNVAPPPPLNEAERMLSALTGPTPPTHCPLCGCPAHGAVRDEHGDWTWCCFEGCNP